MLRSTATEQLHRTPQDISQSVALRTPQVTTLNASQDSSLGTPRVHAQQLDWVTLPTHVRHTLDGVEEIWVYSLPLNVRFRGVTHREGLLLRGEAGWGEAAPFLEYAPIEAARWLQSAIASATHTAPPPARNHVDVNVTIPVLEPQEAMKRVYSSGGCFTAKVKVAEPGTTLAADCERVEAVADALKQTAGARARLRVDVNGVWSVDEAIRAIRDLDRAAGAIGGLEYVEQPCASVEDLARVRRHSDVRIAADESIRRAEDPLRVAALDAADIAVVKVAPLGGVERALRIGADTGLDVVFSSALETSVGLAAGVRAAATLPQAPFACGLATAQLLAVDVTSDSLLPVDGKIVLRPVEPDVLPDSSPVEEAVMQRWVARLSEMCVQL